MRGRNPECSDIGLGANAVGTGTPESIERMRRSRCWIKEQNDATRHLIQGIYKIVNRPTIRWYTGRTVLITGDLMTERS